MNITAYGNPNETKNICEWTGKEFIVDWKHRKQRFINKEAMYAWRKAQNREIINCPTCKKSFERYKNIIIKSTGKPIQYCSNVCSLKSNEKKYKLKLWIKDNNPMNNQLSRDKIKQSKLERYGNKNYNNMEKGIKTNMKKYGIPYTCYLPSCKSNGKRISNFQREIYKNILTKYPDAVLEKYLSDVQKAVDIYIPSIKKVIECHGDYWHCNPAKCKPDYYNKLVHLTAKEVWDRDEKKLNLLKGNGYEVEIIWENANKTFKHCSK